RRRHTRFSRDWSSDVCSSDLALSFLLIPDLLAFWLTGRSVAERTNASTTGLVEVGTGEWDTALMERLDIPAHLARGLVDPGTVRSEERRVGKEVSARSTVGLN